MRLFKTVSRVLIVATVMAFVCSSVFGETPACRAWPLTSGAIQRVVTQINPDIRLVQYGNETAVEQLKGEAALNHLRNAMSRHPDAFAAARREMEKRGFHPTDTVFVERTIRNVRNTAKEGGTPFSLTQSSGESNNDGEILFWSYDGPNSSWTGTIYIEVYSTGDASTWDGQLDTSTTDYPWEWVTETWQGRSGGGGGPQQVRLETLPWPGAEKRAADVELAALRLPSYDPIYRITDWYNWSYCWRAGVIGGCSGAAASCLGTGAGWPGCWAGRCVGAEVGAALTCYMMN